MTLSSNIEAMEKVLSDMRAQRDEALSTYVGLSTDCSNLEALIERVKTRESSANVEPIWEPTIGDLPKQLALVEEPELMEQSASTADTSATGFPIDIDISGATSHVDRVRLLAERLPGRTFKVTDAALWLIDMGVSHSSPDSLTSALYGKFKDRPGFRKTEPGFFQFVGYGDSGDVIPFGLTASR